MGYSLNLLSVLIFDKHGELIFNSHKNFDAVQAVGTKIVHQL